MADNRKRLDELCRSITDCPHSTPKWTSSGNIVIRNNNIKSGRLDLSNPSFTDDVDFVKRIQRATPESGDIIITREAPMGEVCRVPTGIKCCLGQRMVLLKPNYDLVDGDYLLFALMSRDVQAQIMWSEGTGSTVSNLRIPHLCALSIPYLPLEKQKAIGRLLAALDEKININNRINDNLQEQAQTIYASMFLDNLSDTWHQGVLSDIAEITMGQSPSGSSYNETGVGTVFFQGRAEFGFRFPTIRLYTTEPKRIAHKNDVLMSVRAPVGDLNVAHEECCIGRGLSAIHSKNNHQSFVLYTMFSLRKALDVFNGEGTVFGSINRDALNSMPIKIPPKELLDEFETLVAPMDAIILNNHDENCYLARIRDSMLPRLMSGELEVSDLQL